MSWLLNQSIRRTVQRQNQRRAIKREYASRIDNPVTEMLLQAKKASGKTFAELGKELGNRSECWVAALFFQEAMATEEEAEILCDILDFDDEDGAAVKTGLTSFPCRGIADRTVPQDPLIYRLYEIAQVYGLPIKYIVNEKFGDCALSTTDFKFSVDKIKRDNHDRIVITLDGRAEPFRKF